MALTGDDLDITRLMEAVVDRLTGLAHQRGLELNYLLEPGMPLRWRGDVDRLREILIILVADAVESTEQGEVLVRASMVRSGPDSARVRFEVEDTRLGVADVQLREGPCSPPGTRYPSQRGSRSPSFALSRHLVKTVDGEMGLEGRIGNGSVCWFEVPLRCSDSSQASGADPRSIRVLVLEENPARGCLRRQLSSWGLECEAVASGTEALKTAAAQASQGSPFELAILDLSSCQTSGLELARRLEQQSRPPLSCVLLATAAQKQALELGADAGRCLTKPIRRAELFAILVRVMGNRKSTRPVSAGVQSAP